MRLRRAACLFVLCLAPAGAGAVEAVLGVDSNTQYNSNVFSQTQGREQDGSFRGGPYVRFQDRTGKLNWALEYKPSYEAFYTLRGINSFYHFADGEISWQPGADTQLYLNDSFSYTPTRSTTIEPTTNDTVLAQIGPDFSNTQVLQNYLSAGIRHSFTERWYGEISVQSSILDYQSQQFSDSQSAGGQIFGTYGLSRTDRIGTGLGFTSQLVEPTVLDSTRTNYYRLFLIWDHDFSPTWKLNANAGPTLVQSPSTLQEEFTGFPEFSVLRLNQQGNVTAFPTDPATCDIQNGVVSITSCQNYLLPRNAPFAFTSADLGLDSNVNLPLVGDRPSDGGTDVTYFANVEIEKRWKNLTTSLSYVRDASTTSGLNQSLITDTYRFIGTWTPSPLWTFTLVAFWTQRESNADQPQYFTVGQVVPGLVPCSQFVPGFNLVLGCGTLPGVQATGVQARVSTSSETTLDNYVVSTQVNRRVTRESYVYARFTWDRQYNRTQREELFSNRQFLTTSGYQRYVVSLGFVYEFSPIHVAFD